MMKRLQKLFTLQVKPGLIRLLLNAPIKSKFKTSTNLSIFLRSVEIKLYEELNNDIWKEIFPVKVIKIKESPSTDQFLDTTTQVVRSQQSNPYVTLNNDIWNEIFPCNFKEIASIQQQQQPIIDISHQQAATKAHYPISSGCNETCQIIFNDDQADDKVTGMWRSTAHVDKAQSYKPVYSMSPVGTN